MVGWKIHQEELLLARYRGQKIRSTKCKYCFTPKYIITDLQTLFAIYILIHICIAGWFRYMLYHTYAYIRYLLLTEFISRGMLMVCFHLKYIDQIVYYGKLIERLDTFILLGSIGWLMKAVHGQRYQSVILQMKNIFQNLSTTLLTLWDGDVLDIWWND